MEEPTEIPRRLPGAHLFNMAASENMPMLSVNDVTRLGYKLMILPNFIALAAIKVMAEVLAENRRGGTGGEVANAGNALS